jgi:peroxiredoxin
MVDDSGQGLLERPAVRLVLAAIVVGALLSVAFVVRASRGGTDGGSTLVDLTFAPSPGGTKVVEPGLGALDDNPPVIGETAPDFALRTSDGRVVKLSDLRGSVVWVNFWASWCVPCKKELPDIQKVYDEKHGQGLEVLEVNWEDDAHTAQDFFLARNLTLPLLFDGGGSVYDQYRLQGLPDSFFVGRDGRITGLQYGFLTEQKMRERLAAAGMP